VKQSFTFIASVFPLAVCLLLMAHSQNPAPSLAGSPKSVQFIEVKTGVKLEVLDWGGQGRPLVLLAGLGNTAHVFDGIAPKLASNFHVVGITRRGFGDSSAPQPTAANYSAQRLGEDVLAVIHALKLNKPLVAGHSIAGEELSYIGTTHPEEVAGVIYLDAGYPYALYNVSRGDSTIDADELQRNLDKLTDQPWGIDRKKLVDELLNINLPAVEKDLQRERKELTAMLDLPSPLQLGGAHISSAVSHGEQRFASVKCPLLAIVAYPHAFGSPFPGEKASPRAVLETYFDQITATQVKLFEQTYPNSRIVVLPHATHYVFVSNEADVLREIDSFAANLK